MKTNNGEHSQGTLPQCQLYNSISIGPWVSIFSSKNERSPWGRHHGIRQRQECAIWLFTYLAVTWPYADSSARLSIWKMPRWLMSPTAENFGTKRGFWALAGSPEWESRSSGYSQDWNGQPFQHLRPSQIRLGPGFELHSPVVGKFTLRRIS